MGLRIPRRNFRLRAADRHRRAGVHRQPSWKSLFARCEHRLHVLGVRRRRPGARGHYAWTDSGGMDGLCRRPARQSSCRGCSDRQGFVDNAGRRSSGGADHRRPDARRHHAVRAGLLDRRGAGHQSEIFLLQLPRQRRRARGIDRKGAVEELHRRRGAAARRHEQRRRAADGTVRRRGVVIADFRRGEGHAVRHHWRQLLGPADWHVGRHPGVRRRIREAGVVAADHVRRRLQRGVSGAGAELPRGQRAGFRFRFVGDPGQPRKWKTRADR